MSKVRLGVLGFVGAATVALGLMGAVSARAEVPDVTWQDRELRARQPNSGLNSWDTGRPVQYPPYRQGYGQGHGYGQGYGQAQGYGPPHGYGRPFRGGSVAEYHRGPGYGGRCFVTVSRVFDGYGWVRERRRVCR